MKITLPINGMWTLFLDRDGVINHEKKEAYILHPNEFNMYEGVPAAMQIFNRLFGTIVLITNQRGVGRGLMTENDLADIHRLMVQQVSEAGGRIDNIYYCTSTDNSHPNRKPQPGMAHQAKHDFPQIDFGKSIMVGNKLSDMQFGRNAGMVTVYVATTNPEIAFPHPLIDYRFANLKAVADELAALIKS